MKKKQSYYFLFVIIFICFILLTGFSNRPSHVGAKNILYYSSCNKFPNDMVYANKESVELMEKYLKKIDFGGEFKKGNLDDYEIFKNKFSELLSNQDIIYDKDGEEFHLEYFYNLDDLKNSKIYFFDFNEDNKPELCIAGVFGTYIIQYFPNVDEYRLLWGNRHSGGNILGGGKIGYSFDGSDSYFFQLDKAGNEQYRISYVLDFTDKETKYMISLPSYKDNSTDLDLLKSMNQVYFSEESGSYYIRVTKEQMDELHKPYEAAEMQSLRERVGLSYFRDIEYRKILRNIDEYAEFLMNEFMKALHILRR